MSPQLVAAASMPERPDAPTVVTPEWGDIYGELRPSFTGLVEHGMQVEIHVDGQFHGLASVADGGTESDSFASRPSLDLEPGVHSVVFRAKDPDSGLRSPATKTVRFWVNTQVAPALTETVVDSRTTTDRPFVVGFSSNNTTVSVYVDGKLDGTTEVGEHPSNAVHFAYQIDTPLKDGEHTITAVAESVDGRKSTMSKGLAYVIEDEAEDDTAENTESSSNEASDVADDATSSSEDADSDDEAGQSVLGEEDVAEETTDDATSESVDEDSADEESDEEAADEESDDEDADSDDEDEDEEDTDNTALVTWIIVIVVLVIILALRLRSGGDGGDADGTAKIFTADSDDEGGSSDNKNKGGDNTPPPPPPSSSY